MKNVSELFKRAMRDITVPRDVIAKIRFDITETAGDYTTTHSTNVGHFAQLFDEEDNCPNWISLERGRLKLDGSMVIPSYSENYQYGYISELISDENGIINIEIVIDFVDTYSTSGLTFKFVEPVLDFTITLDDVLHTTVTNNQNLTYELESELTYSKIKINVTKVNPYRRVRISELYLGQILEYEGNKIVDMDIINEMSLINDVVPSNELDVTLINEDRMFDLLNPTGVYKYLKDNQPMKPYMGVKVSDGIYEWTQLGKYFLSDWNTDKQVASFEARCIIDQFENEEYRFGKIGTRSLYSMIDELFGDYPHEIDVSLNDITVNSYIGIMTKRDALKLMLQAGHCLLRMDETGKILIDRAEDLALSNLYKYKAGQKRAGEFKVEVINSTANIYINSDVLYGFPKVSQEKPYASVNVKIPTFVVSDTSETLFDGTVKTTSGISTLTGYKVWIPYSSVPATEVVITGTSNYEIYADGCYVYISSDTPISITGKPVSVETRDYIKTKYNFDNRYEIDNTLVVDETMADLICDFILRDFTLKANADYRGFIYFDTGDKIQMETEYGDVPLYITKQEFNYNGALSGTIEGVKQNA